MPSPKAGPIRKAAPIAALKERRLAREARDKKERASQMKFNRAHLRSASQNMTEEKRLIREERRRELGVDYAKWVRSRSANATKPTNKRLREMPTKSSKYSKKSK